MSLETAMRRDVDTRNWAATVLKAVVILGAIGLSVALVDGILLDNHGAPLFNNGHGGGLGFFEFIILLVLLKFVYSALMAVLRPPKGAKLTVDQDARVRELESRLEGVGDVEKRLDRIDEALAELKRQNESLAEDYRFIQRVLDKEGGS